MLEANWEKALKSFNKEKGNCKSSQSSSAPGKKRGLVGIKRRHGSREHYQSSIVDTVREEINA